MSVKATLQKTVTKRNADLEKRNKELDDIKARLEALEKLNETSTDEKELEETSKQLDELKAKKAELEAEKAELEAEIEELNAQIAELDQPDEDQPQRNRYGFMNKESRGVNKMNKEEMEKRAKDFVESGRMTIGHEETRAILVSSGKLATPTGVKETINELPNEVSSIIDMVDVQDCAGMAANQITYEYEAPAGGVTVEGETYNEGDTVFDVVETKPTKVTTISYISEETRKLKPVQYEAKVKKNALNALRKKVSGIVVDKLKASPLCIVKNDLTKFDEKTLRNIALNYGGDENVQGAAVLVLHKNALVALGDVRGTNEKKAIYEITPNEANPNIGIIKEGGLSVKYVLNSNLADNVLIYGQALKFELDLFSDYEVKVSEDFKFDKGLLAVRGSVMLDGTVAYKDGFIVATIGTAA